MYPENNGQDEKVGEEVARLIGGYTLHLLVHDDDVLAYWLYLGGELIDAFWSAPGYFGEENRPHDEKMAGNAEAFRPIIQERANRLPPLLDRGSNQPAFQSERLAEFAEVLQIVNAVTAYEHLKAGERTRIEGWPQFEEIPAGRVAAEAEERRQARNLVKAEQGRLKAEGYLLVTDSHKDEIPYGCAVDGGFFVAWPDHRKGTVLFSTCCAPWPAPQPLALRTPAHITAVVSTPRGNRVALAAGSSVQTWDVSSGKWTCVADFPEADLAVAVSISPNGKIVMHISRKELALTDIDTGRRLFSLPVRDFRHCAFHPAGDWLAVSGNYFALVSLAEHPHWRNLCVGGKSSLGWYGEICWAAPASEPQCADLEEKLRARMEAAFDRICKSGDQPETHGCTDEDRMIIRENLEKSLAENRVRLIAVMEGRLAPPDPQPNERVSCAGFSRDGHWLWCGTDKGLRIYKWTSVPRADWADMPDPIWSFEFPTRNSPGRANNYVYAVTEEVCGAAIVFGGGNGRLYRLDLSDGVTRELVKLPGERWIIGLSMSVDGMTLGIASREVSASPRTRSRADNSSTWEIWSYSRLRDQSTSGKS
ncbi:MAG: WD40 repeat domain-containing protein [Phycisphaerae bacterium]